MATQKKNIPAKKPAQKTRAKKVKKQGSAIKTIGLQLACIAAALAFVLYISTSGYKYAYDDYPAIKDNWLVQKGFSSIGMLLRTGYRYGYWSASDELYRPLSLVTFAIEWQLFPNSPGVSHFMNVFFYALTGFFLFRLLSKLFPNNFNIPFIATLLFIAHPVHTEVVDNIKSRDEILCFLLGIVSLSLLLDYLKSQKGPFLIFSVLAYFLALLAKETAITFIVIIPLMLFVFSNLKPQKILINSLPYAFAGGLYFIIRASVLHRVAGDEGLMMIDNVLVSTHDSLSRFATEMYVLLRYAWLLVFPYHLSFDYSYPEIRIHKISDYKVIAAIVFYAGIFAYAIYNIFKKDKISFGILFYLITIGIAANILILIGTVMADRLLYMPSIGFCIVAAILITKIFKSPSTSNPVNLSEYINTNRNVLLITMVPVLLYSFKTIDRNPVWEDNISLYQSGLTDAPNSSKAFYLYGIELKNRYANEDKDSASKAMDLDMSQKELEMALKLYPGNAQAYRELGTVYMRKNDNAKAIQYFDKALSIIPTDDVSLNNEGVVYARTGNMIKAMALVKECVKWNPRFSDGLRNLGVCYSIEKNFDSAIMYYNEALKYNPLDAQALRFLSSVYKEKGDLTTSAQYDEKAKKVDEEEKQSEHN